MEIQELIYELNRLQKAGVELSIKCDKEEFHSDKETFIKSFHIYCKDKVQSPEEDTLLEEFKRFYKNPKPFENIRNYIVSKESKVTCPYCGETLNRSNISKDHIVPYLS